MTVTVNNIRKFRNKFAQFAGAMVAGLAIVTSASNIVAQEEGGKRPEGDKPAAQGEGERARRPGGGERPVQQRPGMQFRGGQGGDRPMNREGMMGGPMMIPPVMAALDADKDGSLSAAEIENAAKALLSLDKDGDGILSVEELRPKMPEGFRPGEPRLAGGPGGAGGPMGAMMNEEGMKRMFEQRDADKDGKLSGDEVPPPMQERVAMIDTYGDGGLDMDELKVAAQRMRERMGRGGAEGRLQQNRRDGEAVRPKRPEGESSDGK